MAYAAIGDIWWKIFGVAALVCLWLLIWFYGIRRAFENWLIKMAKRKTRGARQKVRNLRGYFSLTLLILTIFVAYMIAIWFGIENNSIIRGLTVVAFVLAAMGIALQNRLAEFLSGLELVMHGFFDEGDWVRVVNEWGISYYGKVTEISPLSTRISAEDMTEIIASNRSIIRAHEVQNFSRSKFHHDQIKVKVPEGQSLKVWADKALNYARDRLKQQILEMESDRKFVDNEEISIGLTEWYTEKFGVPSPTIWQNIVRPGVDFDVEHLDQFMLRVPVYSREQAREIRTDLYVHLYGEL